MHYSERFQKLNLFSLLKRLWSELITVCKYRHGEINLIFGSSDWETKV